MKTKEINSEVAYCIWKIGGKGKAATALNVDLAKVNEWLAKGIMPKGEHATKLAKLARREVDWLTEVDEYEEMLKREKPELYL